MSKYKITGIIYIHTGREREREKERPPAEPVATMYLLYNYYFVQEFLYDTHDCPPYLTERNINWIWPVFASMFLFYL